MTANALKVETTMVLCFLLGRESLGVMDEERHDGQGVDDGQQGNERFEVHGVFSSAPTRHVRMLAVV